MAEYKIDEQAEKMGILRRYRVLLNSWQLGELSDEKRVNIRKAFKLAVEAHKDMRRKSGEPYIYHPIEVATICVRDLGLGETSAVCALLHDVVEDTDYTIDDIRNMFGDKVARIIDGLTKIGRVIKFEHKPNESLQAETWRKILLATADDIRVIMIKLADRLHNMRTLGSMKKEKQLKIASETLYFFSPFAHRLGLYQIKTDLEDLALKFTEPEIYKNIAENIAETREQRANLIDEFIYPIKLSLGKLGIKYRVEARLKSVYSIWRKMEKQQIPFSDVYDLFAIRIIINVPSEIEKSECFRVYSVVTDNYDQNNERLRDWISTPKANGYESLHTTVMSNQGKWVEVQIRTERMNEIAEKGYAAHWKYKEGGKETGLDKWVNMINQLVKETEGNALDFIDEFKLNLFFDEIIVFTPKGETRTLPKGSSVLDFAYSIHSEVGNKFMLAKVDHKLVPLSRKLRSGEQIEVITSDDKSPEEEWKKYVITPRAKHFIDAAIKRKRMTFYEEGKAKLKIFYDELEIDFSKSNIGMLKSCNDIGSDIDLYYFVATEEITIKDLKQCYGYKTKTSFFSGITSSFRKKKLGRENYKAGD
ncbi:MAG: RelA/SpoT family protein [Bacteroidota bacterium]|nr:RelA/SpoT family protein [Bacteroidota bacterium]